VLPNIIDVRSRNLKKERIKVGQNRGDIKNREGKSGKRKTQSY
jgi:hypothetical protein